MSVPRLTALVPQLFADLGRTALANARTAASAMSGQVADRRLLAPVEVGGDPGDLARLDRDECLRLLSSRRVGRLAYVARAGVPDIVPVNHVVHDGDVYVLSGAGPKLQAAERGDIVAFEVDDIDEDSHTGWSVVAIGRARRLSAAEVRALPPQALVHTWVSGPRHSVVRIRPTRLDGRRLT